MIWVAWGSVSVILVVVVVLGLVHLSRHSDKMTGGQKVMWAVLIVLVPFVGLIGYLFWQLEHSEAMSDAMSRSVEGGGRRDQAAPFLRDPGFDDK
jgi:hypothetical protein